MHEFERDFMNTFFYACEEAMENMKIEHLISNFNSKKLIFTAHTIEEKNLHDMDIIELKEVIKLVEEELSTKLDKTLLKLLNIRLEKLIKEEKATKSRIRKNLIEKYKKETLKWMDRPEYMIIQTISTELLKRNLASLKKGLWDKYCDGFIDPWVEIAEMELKVREQETQMKEQMWPSTDGPIHVEKMSGTHIKNCIQRLEKNTKKGFFEFSWLEIFYKELKRRKEAKKREAEERQRKIDFTDKVWEAYNNRDLIVEIDGDAEAIVQDLSVKQLNYGIKEFSDDTMIAILRKELETRNIACLDDYDNDKLFLYGRNVSYMNLTNVSDGIDTIEKNTEYYLENLLECMKHRRKVILFNRHEYEAIKAGLVDLTTWGLERLKELYGEIKCSNDPIERKLCGLYAKAIIVAEERREIGDNMMKRYNAGELTFAYTPVDGKPGTSYIQDMHLEDIINARLTTSGRDYHPAWKKIFTLEFEKRIKANRQAEKAYNFAKRYGARPSTLQKINPEMAEKDLKELLNILRTFRI